MNYSEKERNGLYSAGSEEENALFATFYIVLFILSVPCNALALWVFSSGKTESPSKMFLLNLAVADMCYVLVLPMRVVYHISGSHWPLGEASCRLLGFLFFLNLYCSMYIVACISVDRLLATVWPLKCRLRNSRNAKVAAAILWVTVTACMMPVLFSNQTVTVQIEEQNVTMCNQLYLERASPKALFSTVVAFTIPLVTLSVSYILILCKVVSMTFQGRSSVQHKAVRMIFLTLVNFMVAFVPYHVHRFIYIERFAHGQQTEEEIRSLAFGNRLTSALTCVSGVLDPLMYFFLAKNYQKALLRLCGRTEREDKPQSTT